MKKFNEMSELAQEVATCIDEQLYDCKNLTRKGMLDGEMMRCVIRTAVDTMDNWPVRLKAIVRIEVCDWFQAEYGICL